MTETLQKMKKNRDENKKLLKQKKSLIIKQISDIAEKLITEVESVQEKNEEKINTEKHEICQLASTSC
jgi:hypothetical protein